MVKIKSINFSKLFVVGFCAIALTCLGVLFSSTDANASSSDNGGRYERSYTVYSWDSYDESPFKCYRSYQFDEDYRRDVWAWKTKEDESRRFYDSDDYITELKIRPDTWYQYMADIYAESVNSINIDDVVIDYTSHTKNFFSKVYCNWEVTALDKDKNVLCVCRTDNSPGDFRNTSHTEHIWQCDVKDGYDKDYAQHPWQIKVWYWYISKIEVSD